MQQVSAGLGVMPILFSSAFFLLSFSLTSEETRGEANGAEEPYLAITMFFFMAKLRFGTASLHKN
jgi:hypothetical protein